MFEFLDRDVVIAVTEIVPQLISSFLNQNQFINPFKGRLLLQLEDLRKQPKDPFSKECYTDILNYYLAEKSAVDDLDLAIRTGYLAMDQQDEEIFMPTRKAAIASASIHGIGASILANRFFMSKIKTDPLIAIGFWSVCLAANQFIQLNQKAEVKGILLNYLFNLSDDDKNNCFGLIIDFINNYATDDKDEILHFLPMFAMQNHHNASLVTKIIGRFEEFTCEKYKGIRAEKIKTIFNEIYAYKTVEHSKIAKSCIYLMMASKDFASIPKCTIDYLKEHKNDADFINDLFLLHSIDIFESLNLLNVCFKEIPEIMLAFNKATDTIAETKNYLKSLESKSENKSNIQGRDFEILKSLIAFVNLVDNKGLEVNIAFDFFTNFLDRLCYLHDTEEFSQYLAQCIKDKISYCERNAKQEMAAAIVEYHTNRYVNSLVAEKVIDLQKHSVSEPGEAQIIKI